MLLLKYFPLMICFWVECIQQKDPYKNIILPHTGSAVRKVFFL
mgnify:CR=1 FL=1